VPEKKGHLLLEKELLHDHALRLLAEWPWCYALLVYVNRQIWEKTDAVRGWDMSVDPVGYARLASEIFAHNDQRFRLKRVFQARSRVQEQKSHASKTIAVAVPGEATPQDMARLMALVLEYDTVFVVGSVGVRMPPSFFLCQTKENCVALPPVQDPGVLAVLSHHLQA
jgi:hypothetical protein